MRRKRGVKVETGGRKSWIAGDDERGKKKDKTAAAVKDKAC